MKIYRYTILSIILFIAFAVPVAAQTPATGNNDSERDQGFRGRRGMMDINPEQMQKMMSERLQKTLNISDEEWTVIGPKVMKVVTLSFQSRGNPMRMMMGRSDVPGRPPRDRMPGNLQSGVADKSMQELQKLLEDKNTAPEKIKQQITKIRKEKDKSQKELAEAKKDLRELLTVRQEATLISMGLLD